MHDALFEYIKNHSTTPLSEIERELISEVFVYKQIRKHQYFLQEGDVCKNIGFVIKGALRHFSIDESGNEQVVNFNVENWWAFDRESWEKQTPSIYNIDALENTELLVLSKANAVKVIQKIPAMNEMANLLDQNHIIANHKRLFASISMSAKSRYNDFIVRYPGFLQRFPQHLIASYLGITKETLSRLRKRDSLK